MKSNVLQGGNFRNYPNLLVDAPLSSFLFDDLFFYDLLFLQDLFFFFSFLGGSFFFLFFLFFFFSFLFLNHPFFFLFFSFLLHDLFLLVLWWGVERYAPTRKAAAARQQRDAARAACDARVRWLADRPSTAARLGVEGLEQRRASRVRRRAFPFFS